MLTVRPGLESARHRVERCLHRYSAYLTSNAIRRDAIILAAAVWLATLWTLGTRGPFDRHGILKGVDFLQFYTAGRLVATGRSHLLYDWSVFATELGRAVPGLENVLFLSVYPPPLAVMFAPFAAGTYLSALAAWTVISVALYAGCAWSVYRLLPAIVPYRSTWWTLVLGFVPFQQLVVHGQIGTLVLALLTCTYVAIRQERWFWAGAACGALVFKPQFGVAAFLLIAASRRLTAVLGSAAGAAAVVLASLLAVGAGPWIAYLQKLPVLFGRASVFEPKLWQMQNVKGFYELLVGPGRLSFLLLALTSVAVLALVMRVWVRTESSDLRSAALVIATGLLNPHLYVYDLVIVGLALAPCAAWLLEHPGATEAPAMRVLIHTLCWVPLLAPLAMFTHLQLTAPLLCALLWTIDRAVGRDQLVASGVNHRFQRSARR